MTSITYDDDIFCCPAIFGIMINTTKVQKWLKDLLHFSSQVDCAACFARRGARFMWTGHTSRARAP